MVSFSTNFLFYTVPPLVLAIGTIEEKGHPRYTKTLLYIRIWTVYTHKCRCACEPSVIGRRVSAERHKGQENHPSAAVG